MTRMTLAEYHALGKTPRNKYKAIRTQAHGIWFDSKAEAEYYCGLKLLERAGEVTAIELQPAFVLLESSPGERGITYRADFRVTYRDGRQEVIDVKGVRTPSYRLKVKLLRSRYPEINFREVGANGK
ncbi:DUF1064 domain-containing protein [Gorillibacterium sp. CAU 1737]|uniref:DUF1064 domain-containing protein n=1 Tax=Gorillibacterium sp. CAU 1737 TaxID=3140362 RepID=UPI00326022CF